MYNIGDLVIFVDKRQPEFWGWVCRVVRLQEHSDYRYVIEALGDNRFNGSSGNLWGVKEESVDGSAIPLCEALK